VKVYIENLKPGMSPYNGKGKFVMRLAKELLRCGVEVVQDPVGCDINFRMNALPSTKHGKTVVRLDNVVYSKEAMQVRIKDNERLKDAISKASGVLYQSVISKMMCDGVLGKAKGITVVINNGVDPAQFKGEPAKLEGKKNFLVACQFMHPMRRPDMIMASWKRFVETRKDAWLHVVIGTNMTDVDFSGLENTKVYEIMEQPELNGMMRACDAIISISYQDSCPNAVVESIACGTPAIVSNTNGLTTVVGSPWVNVADIDAELTLKEADWSYPPTSNGDRLTDEMVRVYETPKPELKFPEALNIRDVAKRYMGFFEELLA